MSEHENNPVVLKRTFVVIGDAPVDGLWANAFIASCGLGLNGAWVRKQATVNVILEPNVTEDQIARQPGSIKAAYEQVCGWRNVKVLSGEVERGDS